MKTKPGAMYRPATKQVHDYITSYQTEHGMSWNAAVHSLVLRGIRALKEEQQPAVHRNERRSA